MTKFLGITAMFVVIVLGFVIASQLWKRPNCFESNESVFKLQACVPKETALKDAILEVLITEEAPVILDLTLTGEVIVGETRTKLLPVNEDYHRRRGVDLDSKSGAVDSDGDGKIDERRRYIRIADFYPEIPNGAQVILTVELRGQSKIANEVVYPSVSLDGITFKVTNP